MITTTMAMAMSVLPTTMASSMIMFTASIVTVMSMAFTPSTSASALMTSTSTSTSTSIASTTSASTSVIAIMIALVPLFLPPSRLNRRQCALDGHFAAVPLVVGPSIARHGQRVLLASSRHKPRHIRRSPRSRLRLRLRFRARRQRGRVGVRDGVENRLEPRRAARNHRAARLAGVFLLFEIAFERVPLARQVRFVLRREPQSARPSAGAFLRRAARSQRRQSRGNRLLAASQVAAELLREGFVARREQRDGLAARRVAATGPPDAVDVEIDAVGRVEVDHCG